MIAGVVNGLPQSIEAEKSLLGSILVDDNAFDTVSDLNIVADDFYSDDHRDVWRAMVKVREKKQRIENLTVVDELRNSSRIEGPALFCHDLVAASAGLSYNVLQYAQIVKTKAARRAVVEAASQIASMGYDESQTIEVLMDKVESTVRRTVSRAPLSGVDPSPSAVMDRMEQVKSAGVPTRFPRLNQITGGLVKGHLWVIGGFSSTGKSAVAVNLIQDIVDANKAAVIFSTEMSSEQYMQRLMAVTAGIPTRVLRQGGLTIDQSATYKIARDLWTTAKVLFYDDLYTLPRIRRAAKKAKEKMGVDVVIVDFIQNLSETGDEVKDARLAAIQLQAMAKELDVCVVALSQISNAMAQQQAEGTMGLTNYYAFKGSGAIKDAADVAIMLDRDRVNNPEVLWLNVVKNRHDSIDRIGAKFFLDYGAITAMTVDEQVMADPNAGRKPRKESSNAGE